MIPEQWFSALQLLPKDFKKVLMEQVSSTNHLACTWWVRMKEEESIKEEGSNENKESKNQERNTVIIKNQICEKYRRADLLRLCRE